ncbi:hypothetical protein [Enterococcus sp. HY326]|uniref:hypothetical protein n=1 Tax=Enterococcus sp. HY326 TaxID=2971265 RepID=UPI00223F308D|nr:hypothetical protein [Enterococcus sp. HY326]
MTLLEWGILIGIAVTIILVILVIFNLVQFILRAKKLRSLPKKKPKSKKKRHLLLQMRKELTTGRKSAMKFMIIFIVLAGITGGGTAYASHYQSTNLSETDSELVVQSYLLLRDFETQIQASGSESAEQDAVSRNIRYLTTSLATYGSKLASTANTVEGQTVLNKYYAAVGELGMNASREINEFYGNPELVATYESDIEKIKALEEAAYSYYQVDQAAIDSQITEQEQGQE